MTVYLNAQEIAALDVQNPANRSDGGFQSLLVKMQLRVDRATGRLDLDAAELERIPRYAFDYKRGGWQTRLQAIFGRSLGSSLGRPLLKPAA